MEVMKKTLMELSDLPGACGREEAVRAYIENACVQYGATEQRVDGIGNLLVRLPGSTKGAPVVLLDAHMDEPSFMVKYIDDNGCIFLSPLGVIGEMVAMGQQVTIHTQKGPVSAAFGTLSFHLAASQGVTIPKLDDLWLDAGFTCPEDAKKTGVRPGNGVTFAAKSQELYGNRVMGKAFDDRSACAMLLEVARKTQDKILPADVYLSFSVQEEMYIRGALPVIRDLEAFFGVSPNLAIAYDICLAGGFPGAMKHRAPVQMGAGCGIKLYDKSNASHYNYSVPEKLVRWMEGLAEDGSIPYQFEFLYGATNADVFSTEGTGILAGGISVPCRYTHSPVEIVDLADMAAGVDLTLSCIEKIKTLP